MARRILAVALAMSLVGLGLHVAQAAPPEVPENPNIKDPVGDANYINDQALGGGPVPREGDRTTPVDVGSFSDIMTVWFTHTTETISVHIQTEAPRSSTPAGIFYRVRVDPGVGSNCMWFEGAAPGAGNMTPTPVASLRLVGDCGSKTDVAGEFIQEPGPGTTGMHTITLPRSLHKAFEDGSVLKTPTAETRNYVSVTTPAGSPGATAPQIDNTKFGTEYRIVADEPAASPTPSPGPSPTAEPGDDDDKGKKKCKKRGKKGKGKKCKKRGKKNKPTASPSPSPTPTVPPTDAPAGCPTYTPGKDGAEAKTSVVTDVSTADKPLEVKITSPQGLGQAGPVNNTRSVYYNVQVDSAAAEAGLYVRHQFQDRHDYDLYLYYSSGKEAAHAGGFNPVPLVPAFGLDGRGNGGHSASNYEQLDGVKTPDCGGYTIKMTSYLTTGGETTLKLWLGEAKYNPPPP